MRTVRRRLTTLIFFLITALWAAGAAAQNSGEDTTKVDRFIPTWDSFMEARISYYRMGSSMRTSIKPGGEWILNSSVNIERKSYRGRDMEDLVENLMMNAVSVVPSLYSASFSVGEMYSKKKTLGLARFGKDLIIDNENARFDMMITKRMLHASSTKIAVKGDAARGFNDFKYDKNISGSISGSLGYKIGDLFKVLGGFGTRRRSASSEVGNIKFGGMPSAADTFRLNMDYGKGDEKPLVIKYSRVKGVDRTVEPPKGNSLEILDSPELAKEEESHRKAEKLDMNSFLQLFPFLAIDLTFNYNLNSQKNKVDARLSRETEDTKLSARTSYKYAEKGNVSVEIANSESTVDYGPLSLSSFDEKSKSALIGISHRVSDSLYISLSGSTSLKQKFFSKQAANPRDADYLNYKANARMEASPFPRVSTNVSFTTGRYETINIDRSLSSSNRVDYHYTLNPKFTVRAAKWLSISQDYMIKIEYTDFIHREEDNYLDRTTILETRADFNLSRQLRFNFRHNYRMRDSGSYLSREGEKYYGPKGEDIQHDIYLRVQYNPLNDFSLWASSDFQNQRNNRLGVVGGKSGEVISSKIYESGGFNVGFSRKRKIGEKGSLNLEITYVRNYGPVMSTLKKEYWVVDTGIKFDF